MRTPILLSLLVMMATLLIVGIAPGAMAYTSHNLSLTNTYGILQDAYVRNDTGAGVNNNFLYIGDVPTTNYTILIKFSINDTLVNSSMQISDATLILTKENFAPPADFAYPMNLTVWGSQNQTWRETSINWVTFEQGIRNSAQNLTLLDRNDTASPYFDKFFVFNVTRWLVEKKFSNGLDNLTLFINSSNITLNQGFSIMVDYYSSTGFWPPVLNITYTLLPTYLSSYFEPIVLETKNTFYNISFYDNSGEAQSSDIDANLILNGTNVTYTYKTHNGNYWNFSYVGTPGLLQSNLNITNITVNWTYNIKGITGNITKQQQLNRLRILPCAAPMNNETVRFSIYDEDDLTTRVKATVFDSVFVVWVDSGYRNYSFSNGSYADFNFCIFPGYASANANISVQYSNTSYSTRNYFSQNQLISNTTSLVNLYMLAATNSTNIFFTVYNVNKVPQTDVILKILRFYPSTGTFITVAYGKTGYDGMVMIPMELYQYYKYLMTINGLTVSSTASSQLSSVTQNLYITSGNYIQLFNFINKVTGVCTESNSTKILSCTINDNSGLMTSAVLEVKLWLPANLTQTVCTQTGTTSAMTLTCNLTAYNASNLAYTLTGNFNAAYSPAIVLSSGYINWASPFMQLGYTGVFLAMILTITLFFAGMTSSPSTGIALGSIGILIASLTNLITLGWGNILPLILVGVIIIYKMSED